MDSKFNGGYITVREHCELLNVKNFLVKILNIKYFNLKYCQYFCLVIIVVFKVLKDLTNF